MDPPGWRPHIRHLLELLQALAGSREYSVSFTGYFRRDMEHTNPLYDTQFKQSYIFLYT
jgi:hypothetical protein